LIVNTLYKIVSVILLKEYPVFLQYIVILLSKLNT